MEQWKDIKGFSNWMISDKGRLRRLVLNTWTPVKLYFNPYSKVYMHTMIGDDKKVYTKYIHRMVAEAFVENPDGHKAVLFKDGDRRNNSADNLVWGEQKRYRKEKTEKKEKKAPPIPRYNYFIKQKLLNGCVVGMYNGFKLLELQGFHEHGIKAAAKYKYKNGNKGFTDVYKNFRWEVERIRIKDLEKGDRYVG